ncbi:MAG: glycosyltransferase [Candidatus Woesebacteria bacterium]
MKSHPFVSIIIVNFNGRHLLDECLTALLSLNYPSRAFEIILVDNNSSDDSVPFVLKKFPKVKVVYSKENSGFTGGNILGYSQAKGDYIVLLNSDVRVDPEWLTSLAKTAADEKVGIVSSKLRFALPFIELGINSAAVPRSKVFHTIDHSPIGALIEDILCAPSTLGSLVYYKSGFYDKKDGGICTRRTSGKSTVLLPFDPGKSSNIYILTLHGLESKEALTLPVTLTINGEKIQEIQLHSHEATQVTLSIKEGQVKNNLIWLIQNAGNSILSNGYGKDRGNVILMRDNERLEFYEEESEYFSKRSELLAACGASMLIKREVIDHVGFLDGNYFMYYEDVEFSLRAWRAGWKIIYDPNSIGYHKHRATTGSQESAFFLNLVERNHLAFVIVHFPFWTVLSQLFLFVLRVTITTLKCFVFQFKDNEVRARIWRQKYEGRKAAVFYILKSFPRLWQARNDMERYWPMDTENLNKMLY